jgi:hypothetical protein
MSYYVVFFAIVLLITLLAVYLVLENNRKKAIEAEKKQFNERLNDTTNAFKRKVSELVDMKALRPKHAPKVNSIVSNFFVVQAHNEENLSLLEAISNKFITVMNAEINKCLTTRNVDLLAEQLMFFISELPSSGIAFNKKFYKEILPALIVLVNTPEPIIEDDEEDSLELANNEQENKSEKTNNEVESSL